ncbi:MAG: serine/threonine-protein phosphatase [Clostridiales bacterium]|nr:serine/threonine-protein phosphatase [Clostridiales bacterium]
MKYRISYITDIGPVRKKNEDNYCIPGVSARSALHEEGSIEIDSDKPIPVAVFDGMGGEAYGEEASTLAAETFINSFDTIDAGDLYGSIDRLSIKANNAIVDMACEKGVNTSGSAVAGVVIDNGTAYPFNVGDCRVYGFCDGKLTQLTNDHTIGAKKVSMGIYTQEEAEETGELNMLTAFLGVNFMGTGPKVARYDGFDALSGKVLICCDGLSNTYSSGEIAAFISEGGDVLGKIVAEAPGHGLKDNITCILIETVK